MPSNLLNADIGFPNLQGKSEKEQIQIITNYLFMLLEQLRYLLGNIGISNFNEEELKGMQKLFTGPIQIQVSDMEGNITTIYANMESIVSQVEDVSGNYSNLQIEVDSISGTVSDLSGDFSQVKQDVDGLQIYTQGGVTFISGSHVRSGVIQGSTLKCVLNSTSGESDGELQFYYNNKLVGRIQMDTYGNTDGSGSESSKRVFFEALGEFVLKLISDTQMSLTSKNGNVWISAQNGNVEIYGDKNPIIRSANDTYFEFKDDGIYMDGRKVTN